MKNNGAKDQQYGAGDIYLAVVISVGLSALFTLLMAANFQKQDPEAVNTFWTAGTALTITETSGDKYYLELGLRSDGVMLWRRGEKQ